MRLWNRNEPVVGGWYFILPGDIMVKADSAGLDVLVNKTTAYMRANNIVVPDNLAVIIEDQICQRQPKGKCRGQGLGDALTTLISAGAGAIDAVAGTNLKQKAKTCYSCGKRRAALNSR